MNVGDLVYVEFSEGIKKIGIVLSAPKKLAHAGYITDVLVDGKIRSVSREYMCKLRISDSGG